MGYGQNSVKYRPAWSYTVPPFHSSVELHQKDLRIIPGFLQILGPENEGILRADTFLALFLIVGIYVPGPSLMARRVDIQYPRPCQMNDYSQFMDY